MLSLGDAEILRVWEMGHRLPIAALGADAELVAKHAEWLAPSFLDPADNTFAVETQTWIVRLDGLIVVVDPCNGNGRARPLLPFFDHLETPYIERFKATGVDPEQVDYVFCTHLHCDHCGWNTHLKDGRWTPTFPNARYVFVRREVESWDTRQPGHVVVDYNEGVFDDSVRPIIDAGLADLVGDRHRITPRLAIEPAYGHTVGHSVLRLTTTAGELIFTGDAFHHPLQIVDTRLGLGCYDTAAAIATRDRLRALIHDLGAVMLPAHFQAPHAGYVVRREDEFRFMPIDAWS